MILTEISYKSGANSNLNSWELNGLSLGRINLIVGKNSSGKTRTSNVIKNIALRIAKSNLGTTGDWSHVVKFRVDEREELEYHFSYRWKKPIVENIFRDGKPVLKRDGDDAKIFSQKTKKWESINPPQNTLIFHARRDDEAYPEIEKIVSWAQNTVLFPFGKIPFNLRGISPDSFNIVQDLFEFASQKDREEITLLSNKLNEMGYEITNLIFKHEFDRYVMYFQEKNFSKPITSDSMSQGMFRALMLILLLDYLNHKENGATLIVDDLGEGLDYQRATQLGKILLDFLYENSNIQLIATSNDSFLMDVFPIEYWNILIREGSEVRCLNYQNSKEAFDEFKLTGLVPFDLFSSDYLLSKTQ